MSKSIEDRLRAMEDVVEIANLKARYTNASDGGWNRPSHNADAVAALFAEDGVWEAEGFPVLEGREAIRTAFAAFSQQAPFAFHAISNPLIEVNGDTASGEWHLSEAFTDADGNEHAATGIFNDQFVRVPDGWRIKHMRISYAFFGPRKDGWASTRY